MSKGERTRVRRSAKSAIFSKKFSIWKVQTIIKVDKRITFFNLKKNENLPEFWHCHNRLEPFSTHADSRWVRANPILHQFLQKSSDHHRILKFIHKKLREIIVFSYFDRCARSSWRRCSRSRRSAFRGRTNKAARGCLSIPGWIARRIERSQLARLPEYTIVGKEKRWNVQN